MVGLSFQSMGAILWWLRDFFCTGCCDGEVFLCNGGLESSCRLCIRSERKCNGDIIEDEDSDVFLCWYVAVLRWQYTVGILSGTGWAFDSGQTEFNGNGTEHKVLASVLLQYCGCFGKTKFYFFFSDDMKDIFCRRKKIPWKTWKIPQIGSILWIFSKFWWSEWGTPPLKKRFSLQICMI